MVTGGPAHPASAKEDIAEHGFCLFCQIASSLPALTGWQPPDFQGESWPFPGGDLQTLRSVLRPPKLDLGPAEKILIPAGDGDQLVSFLHLPDDAGNPNQIQPRRRAYHWAAWAVRLIRKLAFAGAHPRVSG